MSFRGLIAHYILVLHSITLSGCIHLLVHLPTQWHVRCFQVLATLLFRFCLDVCSQSFGCILRNAFLDHMVRVNFVVSEVTNMSSKVAVTFCILSGDEWEFLCSTSSSAFGVPVLGHSNRCVMVSHSCFNLHFLVTCHVEHLFMCLFASAHSL